MYLVFVLFWCLLWGVGGNIQSITGCERKRKVEKDALALGLSNGMNGSALYGNGEE